jgi:hypothetical protein
MSKYADVYSANVNLGKPHPLTPIDYEPPGPLDVALDAIAEVKS